MIILAKKKPKSNYAPVDFEGPSLADISCDLMEMIETDLDEALDDVQEFVENIETSVVNLETALNNHDEQLMHIIIDNIKSACEDFLACDECEDETEIEIH